MKAEQVSAHNLPFYAEISYEIKGLRFDQMKILGRSRILGRHGAEKNWNDVFSTVNKRLHQFHMNKSNGKVTRKTRETYFFRRKQQKLKIAKLFFRKLFSKKNEKFHSVSRIVSKLRKLASYRRNTKIKMFPSQLGKDKSKLSSLRTS